MAIKKFGYFNVAPRYTTGSPAMVKDETARQVAKQESSAYKRHLSGTYGDSAKEFAERTGLRGISYLTTERGKWMWVQDIITNELFKVPLTEWGGQYGSWYAREDKEKYLYTADDRELNMLPVKV